MANTTDKSILTAAGKALLAQLNAEEKPLIIDKMIFANVPNRPEFPQPDDVVPTDDIVHQEQVEQRGRLSADSVIYSTTLTSDVGPFEFNWTGAYCSEYGVLVTIDHHALTPKTADEPGVAGNTLVRSVVLEYKDIAEITNITVDASSWQYNATDRMKKMDSDVAQSIIDQNGKDWFIEDGFLVTPSGSAYNIKAGAGYVSGNRVSMEFDRSVQVPNKPSFIYIDAHREGTPTGEQVTLFDFVITAEEKDDYIDASTGKDIHHFVCKIAEVLADGSVSDLRVKSDVIQVGNELARQMLSRNVFPTDPRLSVKPGDIIDNSIGAVHFKNEIWLAWDAITEGIHVISDFVDMTSIDNPAYRVALLVTDKGSFEFVSQTIYHAREKYYTSGFGFQAKADFDNSPAWNRALQNVNNQLIVDKKGTYEFHTGIVGKTQFTLTSLFKQEMNNRSVVFKSTRGHIGNGEVLLKAAPGTTQIQSFKVRNITFQGDTVAPWNDLKSTEDAGIIAIDPSGVKQGLEIDGCVFVGLKHTAKPKSNHGYIGHTKFTNNSVLQNRRVFDDFKSTVGVDLTGTKFYDNYEIGDINRVSGNNVSFNNSSYSHDEAGLEFDVGVFGGTFWLEGLNRFFRVKRYLKLDGGYLSECMASDGSKKNSICPLNDNVAVELSGVRLGTNTRVFYFGNVTDLSTINVEMKACHNGTNFSETSAIADSLKKGLIYKGFANDVQEWNVAISGSAILPGARFKKGSGKKDYIPLLNRKVFWTDSLSFSLDFSETIFEEPSSAQGHSLFEADVVGSNNRAGGSSTYLATIKIYNAFGSVWAVDVSGPSKDLYSVALSNQTSTSVDVLLTETHEGSDDVLIIKSGTSNGKIMFT
ncbi:TPA: phage tail protein [Vibrio parahaemolyticus]|nr:phage tail protein [Vibrio parahaemolyticus]